MLWSLEDLIRITRGNVISLQNQTSKRFSSISIDTRKNLKGSAFIALRGEKFNGHDFLDEACEKKAQCVLIDEDKNIPSSIVAIRVKDTLKALQDLASFYRREKKFRVLGVTGSVGKTTVKNFTYSLLHKEKKTFTIEKSFNNNIGVPLTILEAPQDSKTIIVEIGSNQKGEIEKLTKIAQPNQVLVTYIGTSHREFFCSRDEIAKEKQQIYLKSPKSLQIYNLDQEELREMHFQAKKKGCSCLTYSQYFSKADVFLQAKSLSLNSLVLEGHIHGQRDKTLVPLFGLQNVNNLMAACCFALGENLPPKVIWKNLSFCKNFWGRSEVILLENKATLLFDSYNSSLESSKALLDNIKSLHWKTGKKYLILGEIAEIGEKRGLYHEMLACMVKEQAWEKVWFVGKSYPFFKKTLGKSSIDLKVFKSYDNYHDIAEELVKKLKAGDLVALKASRFMKFEKISNLLRQKIF